MAKHKVVTICTGGISGSKYAYVVLDCGHCSDMPFRKAKIECDHCKDVREIDLREKPGPCPECGCPVVRFVLRIDPLDEKDQLLSHGDEVDCTICDQGS